MTEEKVRYSTKIMKEIYSYDDARKEEKKVRNNNKGKSYKKREKKLK